MSHPIPPTTVKRGSAFRLWCLVALTLFGVIASVRPSIADTNVSGSVSGVWTPVGSPYHVQDDITVEENDSLVILAGTEIIVDGSYGFYIYGRLEARGGTEDANRIRISGDLVWRGFFIQPNASPLSSIENCDILNPWIGIQVNQAYLDIRANRIEAVNIGINCIESSPFIRENLLIRVRGDNTQADVRAISLHRLSAPRIVDNALIEAIGGISESFGIWINESYPTIERNWIDVYSDNGAYGIYSRRTSKVRFDRNIVRTWSSVMMRGAWLVYATGVDITSNDIILMTTCRNAVGILVDEGSLATIINNIVLGNQWSIGDSTVYGEVDTLRSGYNDYWNHVANHHGSWQGRFEISEDPLFELSGNDYNPAYYRLDVDTVQAGQQSRLILASPCINAGSPLINDPGDEFNTPSDIGRWPVHYNPALTVETSYDLTITDFRLLSTYPNPFNSSTALSFVLASPGRASVTVFDLNGRQIQSLWNGPMSAGYHNLIWSARGVPAGEYYVRFALSDKIQTARLVLQP
jgi:hypothetical protein